MIDRFSLKKLSKSLIGLSAYVMIVCLVSVVAVIMKVNTMPVIIAALEVVQNSGSIVEIVLSSAVLVIITLAVIWLIIGTLLSLLLVVHLSTTSKGHTNQSDTQ